MNDGKTIVQVWLDTDGEAPVGGRAPFYFVETEYLDFDDFNDEANSNRMIRGHRLDSRWSSTDRNVRLVHRRTPMSFRGSTVRRAELPSCQFQPMDGEF